MPKPEIKDMDDENMFTRSRRETVFRFALINVDIVQVRLCSKIFCVHHALFQSWPHAVDGFTDSFNIAYAQTLL